MRTIEQVKQDVLAAIDAERERIIGIGEHIWKNPETGYREVKTSRLAADTLKSLGLNVTEKLALTGLRADLDTGKEGPVLAILGEMDALLLPNHPEADPETGAVHACGHNTHIAAMLGTAMGLVGAGAAPELAGKIAFIAAPAEECIEIEYRSKLIDDGLIRYMSGKQELIRCGAFDDVDLSYMLHVGDFCAWNGNGFLVKKVIFHGKSAHAAGPEGSVNALSALTLAQSAIGLLRESLNARDRIHGIVTSGGDAANIIPDTVRAEYLIRSDSIENLKALNEKFDRAVTCSAQALGGTAEVRTIPGDMPMKTNESLFNLFKKTTLELVPDVKISDIFFNPGSTDMGDVSTVVPALHGGVKGSEGACHSVGFRIADPETAYVTNAKIMALMAVDLLYGNAAKGREIAAGKAEKLPIPDYLATLDAFARR